MKFKKSIYHLPLTIYRTKHLRGISLVELLVGMAVLGLMATIVASVYFAHFRIFSNQNKAIEVSSQNRLALDEMTNQIREAESVVTDCANCGGDTTGSTILVLRLWPLDVNSEPFQPSGSEYDFIVYRRAAADNTKLQKRVIVDTGSSRSAKDDFIATNISSLDFAYDNADVTLASEITITLATTGQSFSKSLTNTETAKAQLRNK